MTAPITRERLPCIVCLYLHGRPTLTTQRHEVPGHRNPMPAHRSCATKIRAVFAGPVRAKDDCEAWINTTDLEASSPCRLKARTARSGMRLCSRHATQADRDHAKLDVWRALTAYASEWLDAWQVKQAAVDTTGTRPA